MKKILLTLALIRFSVSLGWCGPIEDLNPGEWYEVPNSHMSSVDPCPERNCPYSGVGGQSQVIGAWGGGAFDTKRDRLMVWGGGHVDYGGNEIYAFDLNTLAWSRITEPSTDVGGPESTGVYPDGNPRSIHSWNALQYIPSTDGFYTFGLPGPYPSGQGNPQKIFCFDFASMKWIKKLDYLGTTGGHDYKTAYDPVTGTIWSGGGQFAQYDPINNVWGKRTEDDGEANIVYWTHEMTTAIEPTKRLMVSVGMGRVENWDISDTSKPIAAQHVTTTGDTEIISADSPGFDYDANAGKLVAWNGGADVYTLDADSKIWTKIAPAATNSVTPTAVTAVGGTHGRFRYSPSKNVFVAVNATTQNVFIYRLSATLSAAERIKLMPLSNASASPNPFQSATRIKCSASNASRVSVDIYDVNGRRICSLFEGSGRTLPAILSWSGQDASGQSVSAGVYLCEIRTSLGTKQIPIFRMK